MHTSPSPGCACPSGQGREAGGREESAQPGVGAALEDRSPQAGRIEGEGLFQLSCSAVPPQEYFPRPLSPGNGAVMPLCWLVGQ